MLAVLRWQKQYIYLRATPRITRVMFCAMEWKGFRLLKKFEMTFHRLRQTKIVLPGSVGQKTGHVYKRRGTIASLS